MIMKLKMAKTSRLLLLLLSFVLGSAWAQSQNSDIFILAGPASANQQIIGGTNVTVYGSRGYTISFCYAYQIVRKSAVSLWLEPNFIVATSPGAERATIPGSISLGSSTSLIAARLMAPLHSRLSVFGTVGGGWGLFNTPTLTADNPPNLSANSVWHGVFGIGGGFDIRLSRHFSIRVDARDYITGRGLSGVPGRNHFLPMLGPAYHF